MADCPECKKGAPMWVVTFGDMMSLLMVFFVMLLSFSTMEAQKFKVIAGYMKDAFGVQRSHNFTQIPSGTTVVSTEFNPPNPNMRMVIQKIVDAVEKTAQELEIEVKTGPRGVMLQADGEVLFAPGSAQLVPGAEAFLDKMAALFIRLGNEVLVEGHTDDQPVSNPQFPSNWELSAARAATIVRELIDRGTPPDSLTAIGHGDTRPIVPNDSEANRARNRRVEFLIVQNQGGRSIHLLEENSAWQTKIPPPQLPKTRKRKEEVRKSP